MDNYAQTPWQSPFETLRGQCFAEKSSVSSLKSEFVSTQKAVERIRDTRDFAGCWERHCRLLGGVCGCVWFRVSLNKRLNTPFQRVLCSQAPSRAKPPDAREIGDEYSLKAVNAEAVTETKRRATPW